MKISHCFFSIILLILYGSLLIFLFSPIDINDYNIADENLFPVYDYIVVGAGSAGSVVASRLAQSNFKVLVLEAGVSDSIDIVKMPFGIAPIINLPELQYLDWGVRAKFERGNIKKTIGMPRGKLVGGCGSINANVWNKGSHKIYDKWEEMGADGWKYDKIKPYFEKIEETLWIQKGVGKYTHKSVQTLLEEAQKLYKTSESYNEKTEGFGYYEATMRNGRRWSTSDAYLKPTLRKYGKNFHIKLNTTVNKLLFNDKNDRAIGVLLENNKTIKANKEVIISAGAINSPALLMRSGIGNSSELKQFGIKVVRDLPGVGQNLQDHPTSSFIYRTKEEGWDSIKEEPTNYKKIIDYLIFGTGQYTSNIAEIGGYFRTNYSQFKDVEDLQLTCGALFFAVPELIEENKKNNITDDFFGCGVTTVTTRDKGSLHLLSLNPNDVPEIKINFLQYEQDLKTMFEGFKIIEKIFETPTFKGKVESYFPMKEELDYGEKLANYIYKSLFELYHPTGTCKMGDPKKDKMVVVDNSLKVLGFENLRVIDASIMPEITNGNTNAPTIMIAEKGADMIINKKI